MKKLIIGFVAIFSLLLVFSAAGWAAETSAQLQTINAEVCQFISLTLDAPEQTLNFSIFPGSPQDNTFTLHYATNAPGTWLTVLASDGNGWGRGPTRVPELLIKHQDWSDFAPVIHSDDSCDGRSLDQPAPGAYDTMYIIRVQADASAPKGNYSTTLTYSLTAP